MSLPVIIRPASPEDAEALLSIYAPYVKHTAITFEYEVPSAEEFRKRIAHTLQHYPYLVAEREINSSAPGIRGEGNCSACTEIAGYAYAGPLHARAAYAWSVENVRLSYAPTVIARIAVAGFVSVVLLTGLRNPVPGFNVPSPGIHIS